MSETMDEVLDILKDTGPEWNGTLANHGPMAAEAIVTLGRGESAVPWVQEYKSRLEVHPGTTSPIRRQDWREA